MLGKQILNNRKGFMSAAITGRLEPPTPASTTQRLKSDRSAVSNKTGKRSQNHFRTSTMFKSSGRQGIDLRSLTPVKQ